MITLTDGPPLFGLVAISVKQPTIFSKIIPNVIPENVHIPTLRKVFGKC